MSDQPKHPENTFDAPYDEEMEKAVIGSVLINPSVYLSLAAFLQPDDFFLIRHQYIWEAFKRIAEAAAPIERQTLRRALEDFDRFDTIGGDLYISELVNSTPSAMYAEQYGRLVERDAVRRRLMLTADDIRGLARDRQLSLEEVISQSESKLFAISERRTQRDIVTMREATSDYFDRIQHMMTQETGSLGLPSGFQKLDALLGGLQRSDLLIFAGRPGMGKTSFMLSLAMNAAFRFNARILVFSLEMGVEQLVQRLVAIETGINMQKLRTGQMTEMEQKRLVEALGRLSNQRIFIDDSPALTPIQMRTKCQRVNYEYGLDLIILDYLQLMHAPGYEGNRVQEISYISRQMKELARELEVPLLSAAQLSRAVEQRSDKRPQLSDLRESGCLAGESQVWLPDEGRFERIDNLCGKSGFRVLSLNQDTYKLEPATVSNAFCTGTKPVYKITTALGRSIRATGNHKFLTIEGWKRLDELKPDEHIAVPRRLFGCADKPMPDAELALLAHLIGDGCTLPRHSIQYTTVEPDLTEIVAALATEVFGDAIQPRIHQEPGRNWYQVFLSASDHLTHGVRNPITVWLDEMGVFGLRSHEKRVPDVVFAQSPEKIALFLRHLWATDGCIRMTQKNTGPYPMVYYATSSYTLAQDVVALLMHLNIVPIHKVIPQKSKGLDQNHVIVSGSPDFEYFIEHIRAVGQYKSDCLNQLQRYITSRKPKSNRDVIPKLAWDLYAVPEMKINGKKMQQPGGRNITRPKALEIANRTGSENMHKLAMSDVYWDKILYIELDGEAQVYDLTVPAHQNFLTNSIVTHNSIEQDADIVMFLYRDVVYNEATENPNQADVIVAKHRNGPTDTVPLYFDATSTRFRDGTRQNIDLSAL